jgi:hypothetical protein
MLSGADETVPIGLDVLRRAADLGDDHGNVLRGDHFDRVPRADGELVGVRLLARDMDAHFAANAALEVDLAPLLRSLDDTAVDLLELDAIDRADLETRLAARAVVGVDDRQLLGNFFAWSFFGHGCCGGLRAEGEGPRAKNEAL